MRVGKLIIVALGLLGLLALPSQVRADEQYTLNFIPTQFAPPGIEGTMTIYIKDGKTSVGFNVKGAIPDTVYTIWIVFSVLADPFLPSILMQATDRPGFPPEGNGVSPLARLDHAFTSGMGLDPGASFITNSNGMGAIQLSLDYDLIRAAPVSNRDVIVQCVPGPLASDGTCPAPSKVIRVTTTWLRRFIGEFPLDQRSTMCANYDPLFDPESGLYNQVVAKGADARFWQCVDPATVNPSTGTGLPRVHRFVLDHFRLANHPDDLTHGFIGGNKADHWIDMVGRLSDLAFGSSVNPGGGGGHGGPK